MQKRIRIVSIGIILIVLFISAIILNNNTNNKHTFKKRWNIICFIFRWKKYNIFSI